MQITKLLAVFSLAIGLGATSAQALSLREGAHPAEFPPASYAADIYVDSRGCVYIRAGFSGAVTWVPRVSRSRDVVCGAQPSLSEAATVAEAPTAAAPVVLTVTPPPEVTPVAVSTPAPVPAPAPAPVAVAAVAPTPAPIPEPTPVPAPSTEITREVTLTCPSEGSNRRVRAGGVTLPLRCDAGQQGTIVYIVAHRNGDRTRVTVNPAPAPTPAPAPVAVVAPVQVAAVQAPAPQPAPSQVIETVHITCPERGAISRAYTNDGREIRVRCGPQTKDPVTYLVNHANGTSTRVVARSVAVETTSPVVTTPVAVAAAVPVAIPNGHQAAWDDGRLNPNRGPRTAAGNAQMNLVWTQTVPRKLVDTTTGRNMTRYFRNIQYPTMPSAAQAKAVAAGKTVLMASAPTTAPQTTTRATTSAAPAGHSYVQVGMFGVAANAQNTAARMQALGLPVQIARVTRSGKTYQLVIAGPFAQQARLNSALSQVRAAGFSDAYTRR